MPAGLFNGMINPLLPGALRGVLWYPGEGSAASAAEYHALFTALITAWRAHFAQGDISFYWVNFAGYAPPADQLGQGRTFAFLREAQTKALALPNTGQAITLDLGDPRNPATADRKSTRLNSSHSSISYAVFCLKKKKANTTI